MAQFRDGPPVAYGPDVDARAYAAWAEQHRADMVHRWEEEPGEVDLHVFRFVEDGLVHLVQGGDTICIPVDDFARFVTALASPLSDGVGS